MPLYDFRCRVCGHQFEALVRDADPSACPSCGAPGLERLLSTFAVSSRERSQASAAASRKKAAASASRDNVVREREMEQHRREDH